MPKTFQVQNHIGEIWFCCLHVWHRRISVHHNLISYYITLPITTTRDGSKATLPYFSGMNPTYQLFGFSRFTTCQCLIHWSYCLALWRFHVFWYPNSVVKTSLCMLLTLFQAVQNITSNFSLIRNLFQPAQNLVFWQVSATCASRRIFSYSFIRNLFQTAQNIVFTRKCCMCLWSLFFLFPNSRLIPKCTKYCVFTGKCCMGLWSHFVLFPNLRLIRLAWPCQLICSLHGMRLFWTMFVLF